VRAFQSARGLGADGLVGPSTLRALQAAPGAAATSSTSTSSGSGGGGLVGGVGGTPSGPPRASTAPSDAYARALPWAQSAHAAGRHTLVIVFEGLWAFSAAYAERIYDYQDALRTGRSPSAPAASGLSFVSSQLIVPNLRESQRTADVMILSETSENGDSSVAEGCARAWHQVHGSQLRLILIGHSFGGYSAIRLGNKLARHQIPVAGMLTVDARTTPLNYRHFIKPATVAVAKNYFQKGLWMPGYAIDGAENTRLQTSHGAIPGAAPVVATYRAMLRAAATPSAP
jgi:hypothetical protein